MASLILPPLDFSRPSSSYIATTPTKPESPEDAADSEDDNESVHSSGEKYEEPVSPLRTSTPTRLPPAATLFTPRTLDGDVIRASFGLERRSTTTTSSPRTRKLIKRNTFVLGSSSGGGEGERKPVASSTPTKAIVTPTRRGEQSGKGAEAKNYRCDIHAPDSLAQSLTEVECKKLVLEAGGRVVDDFTYLGGFLYSLPAPTPNPLATGPLPFPAVSSHSANTHRYICITPYTPFPPAHFNGLRLTYSGAILPVPQHRVLPPQHERLLGARSCHNLMTAKRTSAWLGQMVKGYGGRSSSSHLG